MADEATTRSSKRDYIVLRTHEPGVYHYVGTFNADCPENAYNQIKDDEKYGMLHAVPVRYWSSNEVDEVRPDPIITYPAGKRPGEDYEHGFTLTEAAGSAPSVVAS